MSKVRLFIFTISMGAVLAIFVTTLPVLLLNAQEEEEEEEVTFSLQVPGCLKHREFELDDGIITAVCSTKHVCYLNFRQFVKARNGTYFSTIKGIQLSVNNWNNLKKNVKKIDMALNI